MNTEPKACSYIRFSTETADISFAKLDKRGAVRGRSKLLFLDYY